MSRRLKRKIRDICQLDHLSKEERRIAATTILNDNLTKQKLCNSMPGLSFKDIDRTMKDIIAERQPTEEQLEEQVLRHIVPEKFEPMSLPGTKSTVTKNRYRTLTPDEAQTLIDASDVPFETELASQKSYKAYPTYTMEEAVALINGTYNPNIFKKGILRRKR